jgi:hypothetical protein
VRGYHPEAPDSLVALLMRLEGITSAWLPKLLRPSVPKIYIKVTIDIQHIFSNNSQHGGSDLSY